MVATTGGGRAVSPLGALKVWLDKSVKRAVGTTLSAGGGRVEHSMSLHGKDLGGVTAVSDGRTVTVSWRTGLVDRARVALSDLQARLVKDPDAGTTPGAGSSTRTPRAARPCTASATATTRGWRSPPTSAPPPTRSPCGWAPPARTARPRSCTAGSPRAPARRRAG
ncbi:hypothetical protein ACFQV2_31975 [Actinokineospora soli]|uniref:Uncharacterized protein n=1 Tax=Actinokineospora soli TaxID=1048753 RepID=A0ABW2TTZ1_9PSEU